MKRKLRRGLMVLLALIFVGSLGMVIYRTMEYKEGEEIYAEAAELVQLPDLSDLPDPVLEETEETEETDAPVYVDPYADALRNMDFAALREVNSDVLGWILIPNTVISYPLVQGDDNQYYLKHTWKKWTSAVGAIFLEYQNSPDFSDFNTIIYGHRMNNGSMFASLKNYKKQSYWAAHPYVYITDDNGSHKYEIFAAYEVSTAGTTYQIGFSGDASKQAFLDYCLGQSVIDTGITPTVHDKILTLSTCTGNGHATRWVVQARLKGVAPSDSAAEAAGSQEETTPPEESAPVETTPEETVPSTEPPQTPTQPQDQGAGEAPSAAVDPQEPVNGAQTQDPSQTTGTAQAPQEIEQAEEAGSTEDAPPAPEGDEQEEPILPSTEETA